MSLSRRSAVSGAFAFAFTVSGIESVLTPREARAQNADFKVLSAQEVRTLESFGEVLLPGAAEDGIAHFVDHQLAAPPADCLLMLRYLDVPPPYVEFYRPGLAALNAVSQQAHGKAFAQLDAQARQGLVGAMSTGVPAGWQGPPAPLFFFVVRSDAVDVVYGTPDGFAKLGVPYMPHIMPTQKW